MLVSVGGVLRFLPGFAGVWMPASHSSRNFRTVATLQQTRPPCRKEGGSQAAFACRADRIDASERLSSWANSGICMTSGSIAVRSTEMGDTREDHIQFGPSHPRLQFFGRFCGADGAWNILYADLFAKPLANLLIVIGYFPNFRCYYPVR